MITLWIEVTHQSTITQLECEVTIKSEKGSHNSITTTLCCGLQHEQYSTLHKEKYKVKQAHANIATASEPAFENL